MLEQYSKEQVLTMLLKEGAELWNLYLDGGVTIHDKNGEPLKDRPSCPVPVFIELRKEGVITRVRRNETGYPYYADRSKSDFYKIAK